MVHHGAVGGGGFEEGGGRFAFQQLGQRRRVDDPARDGIVGIGRRNDVLAGADGVQQAPRLFRVGAVALRAELLKNGQRLRQVTLGDRPRPGLRDQAAEREMAERRLISFAE